MSFDLLPVSFHLPEIKDEQTLINVISTYFDAVKTKNISPTFTGLSLFLGINRTTLRHFPANNNFAPIIERAKQYIVDYAERQLFEPKSSAGVAFWLKNNDDWVDKTEIDLSSKKTMTEILEEINQKNNSPIAYELPQPNP